MRIRSLVVLLLVGISLSVSSVAAAPRPMLNAFIQEPAADTPVVVAEDRTSAVDCHFWDDSPSNRYTCPPGSVLFARPTTYAEVKERGISNYVIVTPDASTNARLEYDLISKMFQAFQDDLVRAQACITAGANFGGDYLVRPDDPTSTRIFFAVSYQVLNTCQVTNAFDSSRTDGRVAGWDQSCSQNNFSACADRFFNINGNWTANLRLWDTVVGQEYTHIGSAPCFLCGRPYTKRLFHN